jgi:ferredoxin
VSITFIDRDGDKMSVKGKVGDSLLDVAKDNDIDLEGICIKVI